MEPRRHTQNGSARNQPITHSSKRREHLLGLIMTAIVRAGQNFSTIDTQKRLSDASEQHPK